MPNSEEHTTADASNPIPPISDDAKVIDYTDVSAPVAHQPSGKEGSPLSGASPAKLVLDEPPTSFPSLLEKLTDTKEHADFRHPATMEEQRIIWLPKDQLGLVHEIERELDSQDILHSTECAEMDDKGYVDVTIAPEDGEPPLPADEGSRGKTSGDSEA